MRLTLAQVVGILGIFSELAGDRAFYANCMGLE